jgi:hypothetical protein
VEPISDWHPYKKRTRDTKTDTGRNPCKDRGRNCCNISITQGTLWFAGHHQNLGRRHEANTELREETNPADTQISNFSLQDCETINFCHLNSPGSNSARKQYTLRLHFLMFDHWQVLRLTPLISLLIHIWES